MEYLVGVVLAIAVCVFAVVAGFDRDRVFYPTLVIVVAHYYILFAVLGRSTHAVIAECIPAAVFLGFAVAAFHRSLWLAVVGLAGHGVFDFFHHLVIQDPGVPVYWPGFCLSFDIVAALFLAMLLLRRSGFASRG